MHRDGADDNERTRTSVKAVWQSDGINMDWYEDCAALGQACT
jgi:hypothetical protein